MPAELSTPLADIIKRAAQTSVEGPAARMKKRFAAASEEIVVLADCSSSMWDLIGNSGLSKFQHLDIALKDVRAGYPEIRLIAFGNGAWEIKRGSGLPPPKGGTDMEAGLKLAAEFKPRKTIVISDGLPDNEETALRAADELTGAVDTIYCGPDQHPAAQFLHRLSRSTGGVSATWQGYHQLAAGIRALLPAPR
jgi:hypothetical protein